MAAEARLKENLRICSQPTLSNAIITLSHNDHQDQRHKHTVALVYYKSVVTL